MQYSLPLTSRLMKQGRSQAMHAHVETRPRWRPRLDVMWRRRRRCRRRRWWRVGSCGCCGSHGNDSGEKRRMSQDGRLLERLVHVGLGPGEVIVVVVVKLEAGRKSRRRRSWRWNFFVDIWRGVFDVDRLVAVVVVALVFVDKLMLIDHLLPGEQRVDAERQPRSCRRVVCRWRRRRQEVRRWLHLVRKSSEEAVVCDWQSHNSKKIRGYIFSSSGSTFQFRARKNKSWTEATTFLSLELFRFLSKDSKFQKITSFSFFFLFSSIRSVFVLFSAASLDKNYFSTSQSIV